MDIIFIHDLQIDTIIGIFDWERQIKQTVFVDLDMGFDIKSAAASDKINDALDYKMIAKRIINFVEHSEFQLVETLAEQIAAILIKEFHLTWTRVRVNKRGAVRNAQDVGVIIERSQI